MPMTNAERQARFRFRQKTQGHFKTEGTPMERLDAWVSSDAAHGLRVLAALNAASVQEALDRLIRVPSVSVRKSASPAR